MKTLHRYKKVIRNTLLTIITASFFVVSSVTPARAATSSTTVTSYGQYFYESGYDNTNSIYQLSGGNPLFLNKGAVSYVFFQYNFKNTYDGYVNLTLTANSSFAWQNVHFVVDGGVFTQQPNMTNVSATKSFQISFQNSTGFTLSIVSDSSSTFTTTSSITVGSSNFNLVPDVPDDLHYLRGRWDYYVPGMSTNLSTIATNSTNIANDIAILKSSLDGVEGYLDDIETLLHAIYGGRKLDVFRFDINQGKTGDYEQISYSTESLNSDYYYSTALDNYTITRLDSRFNYDISDYNYLVLSFYLQSSQSYSLSNNPFTNSTLSVRDHSNTLRTVNKSLYFTNYYGSYNSSASLGVYLYTVYIPTYLLSTSTGTWEWQIALSNISCINSTMAGFIFRGGVESLPLGDKYLSLLQQIATGIGNISQQQIVENNTNINNYNNYQQQINNVENNYYQEFNTYENNIETNNTFDFTGLSTDGVQVYHNLFSNLYGISLVKWPVLITLLGLVIVIILG